MDVAEADGAKAAEKKKTAVFLTVIWANTYQTVRSLFPNKPSELMLQQLIDKLDKHIAPKRIMITERYRFHCRKQLSHESVGTYLSELHMLTEHPSSFATFLDEAIRD